MLGDLCRFLDLVEKSRRVRTEVGVDDVLVVADRPGVPSAMILPSAITTTQSEMSRHHVHVVLHEEDRAALGAQTA